MTSKKLPISVSIRGLTKLRQMTFTCFWCRSANPSFSLGKDRNLAELNRGSGR